jgi:hypothetical protein
MKPEIAITRLTASVETLLSFTRKVSAEQARWKPSPDEWSILEVICHLYDEEREDFRMRIDYILHRPGEKWPPIDPGGWVTARGYNRRDFAEMTAAFRAEREGSLKWLAGLRSPDWARHERHPRGGDFRAIDMLNAWAAHDHLHIRQLNELHWQYLATQVEPLSLEYAGGW